MRTDAKRLPLSFQPGTPTRLGAMLILACTLAWLPTVADAQRRERSGKAVVEGTCAACHAKGEKGAPQIGDVQAWAPRSAQGLSTLTATALRGIRDMPAHGGNPGLSDIEVERAVTYMVNQSGGHWVEPLGGAGPAVLRTGEQLVLQQCARCHQDGQSGAPKIGDRASWMPRLAKGLDAVLKSAVHGHGAMPARGGVADATDAELQGAIVYMFNYGVALAPPAPAAPTTPPPDPYHKVVDGTDVYLGLVRAEAAPAPAQKSVLPRGRGYYHLNVSLFDARTKSAIPDAKVKVKVTDPTGIESKTLRPFKSNGTVSYGGFFRMRGPDPYTITAQIERPGDGRVREATFEYRVW